MVKGTALLVLPLFTAAVPWRSSLEFSERVAWVNTGRVLAIPLPFGFQMAHLAWLFGAAVAILTLWRGLKARYASHRAIARWTFPIWMYVSVTGVLVYLALVQGLKRWALRA